MNDRAIRTALIISLLINAFLAAATAAGGVYISTVLDERANMRQHTPLAVAARDLDPSVRAQLKARMHDIALSAAPDFQEARAARKQAADLVGAPNLDAAAVDAELAKARAAEARGRARLETGMVEFLKTQPQATRAKLAKVLAGRGSFHLGPHPGGPGGPGRDHGGPPSPDGPPPPPPER
jgi:uncharacterized membrane protein